MFPLFDPAAIQRAQQIGRSLSQPAPGVVPPTPVGMELSPIRDSERQIPQEAFYPPGIQGDPMQMRDRMRQTMGLRRGYSPGLQPSPQMPTAQGNQGRGQFSGQVQYASAPWSGGQAPQPQYQPQPPRQMESGMGGGWGTNRNPQWEGGGGGWQSSQPSGGDRRAIQARPQAVPTSQARQF